MKRSNMVKKLTSIVIQKTNWCFDDSLMFAQEMLDEVEEVGMLPPFGSAFKQVDIEDKWGQITGRKEVRVIEPAWEAE